ncbi:MAG: 4Fe-4S ferredoxin [Bacteroidales bacterium]|nr:4Fe-4S ferredoxin [Bacteroidales bacterium]
MLREIIKIDEEKCNGCAACIPNCHEGALQIVDGKAVLVSDLMCDGLGACLGHCPEGALSIVKMEAEPYNETVVMKEMVSKGKNVVIAHLSHLKEHGETEYLKEGVRYLMENKASLDFDPAEVTEKVHNLKSNTLAFKPVQTAASASPKPHACPGSASREFKLNPEANIQPPSSPSSHSHSHSHSALSHWPVQLHLINPSASYFQNADLLVAADCSAYAAGNFHADFLSNKKLVIACPKLDRGLDTYIEKLIVLINESKVNTITVLRMEVPCCGGLVHLVKNAVDMAGRKVPVKEIVLGIKGEVLGEEWI